MGHFVDDSSNLFRSVEYNTKTTAEIREAMQKKVVEIKKLSQEREVRIQKIRDEYQIDAERLANLVIQFQKNDSGFVSYNNQNQSGSEAPRLIPAGVIANIISEREMIDSERDQLRKLELVLRNLRDTEYYTSPRTGEVLTRLCLHELTDKELEYLGF